MLEFNKFLKDNITLPVIISLVLLLLGLLTFIINSIKFRFDKTDFKNKKVKFSLYLENSYRFNYKTENERFLLFDIRINNYSTLKTSFLPKLKVVYFIKENSKSEIFIEHNPSLFHEQYHNNLSKFSKQIRVEDREIKSGWIIFNFPENLLGKRIDYYEIVIEDVLGNKSNVICNLIKEIDYGN